MTFFQCLIVSHPPCPLVLSVVSMGLLSSHNMAEIKPSTWQRGLLKSEKRRPRIVFFTIDAHDMLCLTSQYFTHSISGSYKVPTQISLTSALYFVCFIFCFVFKFENKYVLGCFYR